MIRIPTPDELEARVRETRGRIDRLQTGDPESFCPVSLGDWLELCRRAQVPHVPAERVGEVRRDDYLMFDTPGPHRDRLEAVWESIQAARLDHHMMRLDCCSDAEVKYQLSRGRPEFRPEFGQVILGDPRSFDIVAEHPRETLPVWRRPWVRAMRIEGYPVEYRAYVRDGRLAGISNYYPQRPLPHLQDHIERVRAHVDALLRHIRPPFLWNRTTMLLGCPLDLRGVHFTADFLVDERNETLFLEGGPPHELGAHMCCFRPGGIDGGVALEDRNAPEGRSGNPDLMEMLEWRVESHQDLEDFVNFTQRLDQRAEETLYLDEMGNPMGSREAFLDGVRERLAPGNEPTRLQVEVDRDADGTVLMLESRVARY